MRNGQKKEKKLSMLMPVTSKVNSRGHLVIGGCDTVELQQKYGTPVYVIDIATIKKQCRSYKESFNFTDLEAEVIYASKAFAGIAICQLIGKEGLSLDVSTGGELYIALKSGFPADRIFFHGNNKSKSEIEYSLENKVGCFIVDNFKELEYLNRLCKKYNLNQKIMLRITPGIKASTHEYIQTGMIESKFGFGLHHNGALSAVEKAAASSNLTLVGFHAHVGSQIFNLACYSKLVEVMFKFIRDVKNKLGLNISHINVGGGLGIKYIPEDEPPAIDDLSRVIYQAVKKNEKRYGIKLDKVYLEPGRSIVGNSGMTFYEVGVIKEIPGVKNYISVDGGMSDNIRPMLYKAKYNACIANKMGNDGSAKDYKRLCKTYSIVGKHCESGDVLIPDIALPDVCVGDLIAIAATGAYCYSMASNYNGQPKSAVVAVEDGKSWVWIKREEYKDLILGDRELYE